MKKILSIFLGAIIFVSISACSGDGSEVTKTRNIDGVTISICLQSAIDTGQYEDKEELLNIEFPFTVRDARDMCSSLKEKFPITGSVNTELMHYFPALEHTDFRYTRTDPTLFFDERKYDDYEWNYGTPSNSYVNMFEFSGYSSSLLNPYGLYVDGVKLMNGSKIISKDELVSLYGKYDTVQQGLFTHYYFAITKDVYLIYSFEGGYIKLVYPYLNIQKEDKSNIKVLKSGKWE